MKLVILDGYASNPNDLSWEALAEFGELTVYDRTPPELVIPRISDAEIVLLNKTPIGAEVFAACPKLRLISVLATGYNIIDLTAAAAHGVTICNVPNYSTHAVAQMTFALLLELCHHVGAHSRAVFDGQWQNAPDFCFWNTPLIELAGKTMGIIGYGAIGHAVAATAQTFGLKLLISSRREKPVPDGARFVPTEELLAQSDIISLHCPQNADNLRMINAEALGRMKDGAILLNTARGGLIDEAAVAEALKSGKLLGYAADVVSQEPISAHNPLLSAPNCILTPHIAWAPQETRRRLHRITAENVRQFLSGTPQNVVTA